jgi:hypothetical protein
MPIGHRHTLNVPALTVTLSQPNLSGFSAQHAVRRSKAVQLAAGPYGGTVRSLV